MPATFERFFPLLLAVFILAEAVVVLARRFVPPLPRPSAKVERTAGVVLLLVAVLRCMWFTGYSCLAISVATMGIVMNLNSDPDASPTLTGGFVIFAIVFVTLTIMLYRPLSQRSYARAGSHAC